jgi:hypothetical protein
MAVQKSVGWVIYVWVFVQAHLFCRLHHPSAKVRNEAVLSCTSLARACSWRNAHLRTRTA